MRPGTEKCSAGTQVSPWSTGYQSIITYCCVLPILFTGATQMRRDRDTTKPRKSCRRILSLFSLLLYIIITRLPTAGKKYQTPIHVPAYTLCLSASVSVSAPGPIPYCLGPSRRGPPSFSVQCHLPVAPANKTRPKLQHPKREALHSHGRGPWAMTGDDGPWHTVSMARIHGRADTTLLVRSERGPLQETKVPLQATHQPAPGPLGGIGQDVLPPGRGALSSS